VSVTGIAANMLFQAVSANAVKKSHGSFAQVHSEVQQLGQDLQAGNLAGAQQDFAALSKNFPTAAQTSASSTTASATTGLTNTGSTTAGTTGTSPAQAFSAVGQALQSGNLSAAQTAFATLQQDFAPGEKQTHVYHDHQIEGDGESGQGNPIAQTLNSILQDVQSGNFSAAQTAYATMQQMLGGLGSLTSLASTSPTSVGSILGGGLNITV